MPDETRRRRRTEKADKALQARVKELTSGGANLTAARKKALEEARDNPRMDWRAGKNPGASDFQTAMKAIRGIHKKVEKISEVEQREKLVQGWSSMGHLQKKAKLLQEANRILGEALDLEKAKRAKKAKKRSRDS